MHATGDAGIAGNDRSHALVLRHRHDALGKRLECGIVLVVGRQQDRGDIAARKRVGQPPVEIGEHTAGRGDQHDAAAVRRGRWAHVATVLDLFAMGSDRGWIGACCSGPEALVDTQAFEQAVDIAPVNASFPAQNLLCHAAGTHSRCRRPTGPPAMTELFADPLFYVAAVPAVILVGLSKGGLGGSMGFIGVPLMALAMPPVQAAAILLPILVLMDIVSLWSWRGVYDRSILKTMMPGALIGIAHRLADGDAGDRRGRSASSSALSRSFSSGAGSISNSCAAAWSSTRRPIVPPRCRGARSPALPASSRTSGGPPYQVYTLPLRLDPKVFTGTSVIFFAVDQRAEARSLFRARPVRHRPI